MLPNDLTLDTSFTSLMSVEGIKLLVFSIFSISRTLSVEDLCCPIHKVNVCYIQFLGDSHIAGSHLLLVLPFHSIPNKRNVNAIKRCWFQKWLEYPINIGSVLHVKTTYTNSS